MNGSVSAGYELHSAVRVPHNERSEPPLIQELLVTSPIADFAEVTLELIDAAAEEMEIEGILVDRRYHYRYQDPATWARQLINRGINQCLDLLADYHGLDHRRRNQDGCGSPALPDDPDTPGMILRRGPTGWKTPDDKLAALQEFGRAIDLGAPLRRQTDRSRRTTRRRWYQCPARAGQIGCPLANSDAAFKLPRVQPVIATA